MRDGVAVGVETYERSAALRTGTAAMIDEREQRADDRQTRERIVVAPESDAIGDHDRDRREDDDHAALDQRDRERVRRETRPSCTRAR